MKTLLIPVLALFLLSPLAYAGKARLHCQLSTDRKGVASAEKTLDLSKGSRMELRITDASAEVSVSQLLDGSAIVGARAEVDGIAVNTTGTNGAYLLFERADGGAVALQCGVFKD